jgi:hypothetical protein
MKRFGKKYSTIVTLFFFVAVLVPNGVFAAGTGNSDLTEELNIRASALTFGSLNTLNSEKTDEAVPSEDGEDSSTKSDDSDSEEVSVDVVTEVNQDVMSEQADETESVDTSRDEDQLSDAAETGDDAETETSKDENTDEQSPSDEVIDGDNPDQEDSTSEEAIDTEDILPVEGEAMLAVLGASLEELAQKSERYLELKEKSNMISRIQRLLLRQSLRGIYLETELYFTTAVDRGYLSEEITTAIGDYLDFINTNILP